MASTPPASRQIPRRAVAAGLSWTAPAIALAAAAPAMAVSPGANNYVLRSSIYSGIERKGAACNNTTFDAQGNQITNIYLTNQEYVGTSPRGFAVVELAKTNSSLKSDRTTATLKKAVQFVVAYPQGMVDLRYGYNGFNFAYETDVNWSAPTVRQMIATNPDNIQMAYDVFTFTWKGNPTQSTVADNTFSGTYPASWAGTALQGAFYVRTGAYCVVPQNSHWYYAGYYLEGKAADVGNTKETMGTFTTANGRTGGVNPLNGNNWINFQQYIWGA